MNGSSATRDRLGIMTKSSNPRLQGTLRGPVCLRGGLILVLLLLIVACAGPRPLAVPERVLALRQDLPLDAAKRETVVNFIAAGGQLGEGSTVAVPVQAVEQDFGKVLDLLRDSQNLHVRDFEQRLSAVVRFDDRGTPVIDASEQYPDELGRVAYLLKNFWFAFYAQKESPEGDPLPGEQWTFKKVILFRDRPPK